MKSRGRIRGIEGLRGIAAIAVLAHHVHIYTDTRLAHGGWLIDLQLGVTLFFALSGFLLYQPFVTAFLDDQEPAIARYARNRAARILPAYWVVLTICAAFTVAGSQALSSVRDALLNYTLTQNYTVKTFDSGLGPSWTLVIEVAFYIFLPAATVTLLWYSRRFHLSHRRVWAFAPAVALLAIGVSGKIACSRVWPASQGLWTQSVHGVVVHTFWAQADLFSFGMAAAVIYVLVQRGELSLPKRWRMAAGLAAVVCGIVALPLRWEGLTQSPANTVAAASAAIVVLLVALSPDSRSVKLLERGWIVYLGTVSYSIYLWNQPVAMFMAKHQVVAGHRGWAAYLGNLAIAGVITLALSTITYYAVEKPSLQFVRRISRRDIPAFQVESAP